MESNRRARRRGLKRATLPWIVALACALACLPAAGAAPVRELAVAWPNLNSDAWKLLRQLRPTAVLTPLGAARPAVQGIPLIADIDPRESPGQLAQDLARARELGYDGAAVHATGDLAAFRAALRPFGNFVQFVYLNPKQLDWDVAPARAVFYGGLWPGLQAADTGTAAATEKPWINANLHVYAYLRAFWPGRTAWVRTAAPKPDTRYDSAEVALAEAFAAGGNGILQLPEMYREGLLKAVPRALKSWELLCNLADALRKYPALDALPSGSSTAVLAGSFEDSEELINLPSRNNLSPRVLPAGRTPDLRGVRVLAAVNHSLSAEWARSAIEFTRSGGILVAAPEGTGAIPWLTAASPKKVKDEKPWSLWELGAGRIYLYPEAIFEPSEFAQDLREISGLDNPRHTGLNGLDFRVWNATTVLGVLYEASSGGKRLVLISYGQGMNRDFLIGVRGKWATGVMRQPGVEPLKLDLMPRGWFVEANLKAAGRLAVIELEGEQP